MSTFEIIGTVVSAEEKTSSKGNSYIAFHVQDNAKQVFDMSLFGDSMNFSDKIAPGKKVSIKGVLRSREYTDKNGVARFNTVLNVNWIEALGKQTTKKQEEKTSNENSDLDDLPF